MANMELFGSQKSNDWETPQELYDDLNKEFQFTLDPCCTKQSSKCNKYYTEEDNGLLKNWSNEIVFMNPPYGRNIINWMEKAYLESLKGAIVVCLVFAKTDTKWWHEFAVKGEVRFIRGRLKFINKSFPSYRSDGNFKKSPAPFGSAVIIFKPDMENDDKTT